MRLFGGKDMQIEKLRGQGLMNSSKGFLTLENLEECYAFLMMFVQ